ncbi:hypothetical protein BCT35_05765 [Vibrio lentus]|uniref:hypothetical protein n=1 Tax=Vibrio lentus TaxID=136468 RepID=UPI000C83158B|nr:hypothetical protein [Vibrio lentus]PMN24993.1 hypothetical protein BCT35_05765 [Vibrio lentus]
MSDEKAIFEAIQKQFNSTDDRTKQAVNHLATNYAVAKGLQIEGFWAKHGAQFQREFNSRFAGAHNFSNKNASFDNEQKLSAFEKHMALSF